MKILMLWAMSRKIIIFNILILLLILVVFLVGSSIFDYSYHFSFRNINTEELRYFVLILLGTFLLSLALAFVLIGHFTYWEKQGKILGSLNLLFLLWMLSRVIPFYIESRNYYERKSVEYAQKIGKDIAKGNFAWYFVEGLPLLEDFDEEKRRKIDSIYAKYSVRKEFTGCIVMPFQDEFQQKYKEIAKKHLDKRNGAGWETKMQSEIENINKDKVKNEIEN